MINSKSKDLTPFPPMGINEMSLFPSVDGICRAMRARFFSQNTVGLTPTEWLSVLRAEAAAKTENKS